MIRRYDSGAAFLAENQAFLDTKPQISAFMALDAPLLEKRTKSITWRDAKRTEKRCWQ